ncbi:MAG: DUF1611 domain-containing protein [Clostridiales bacterium]|nr:DUF1611 domain-containing protein [Clostridiales bacterium]
MSRKMYRPTIVVVDSGIDSTNPLFQSAHISGIGLKKSAKSPSGFSISGDFQDQLGHGTGVCSLIAKKLTEYGIPINFYIVKIFDDKFEADENSLLHALTYICDEIDCDILNLSLGTTICTKLSQLREVCEKLYQKGAAIVSAFDNSGAMSYPASFPHVIGVDICEECGRDEIYFVEDSPVNILTKNRIQRCEWLNNKRMLIEGSSFNTAIVTALIAKLLYENGRLGFHEVQKALKKVTLPYNEGIEGSKQRKKPFAAPKKAVVFPFNKEIHALRRYEESLDFTIVGYYDTRYSGKVGKPCDVLINQGPDRSVHRGGTIVQDISELDWGADFDTVILGHLDQIIKLTRIDYHQEILSLCQKFHKNIFSFDDAYGPEDTDDRINIYTPMITPADVPHYTFGKLYRIGKPVIGVFGTSAKQGKFTLQMALRRQFLQEGYKVGQLGTEPHSELFGCEHVFPMGYQNGIHIDQDDVIPVINSLIHDIEMRDPDLIIVGGQSSTIPFYYGNVRYMSDFQQQLLYATVPDCVLLVVNIFDDIPYIKRTIHYLNSISTVIAIAVSPITSVSTLGNVNFQKALSFADQTEEFEKEFGLPVYRISEENDRVGLFRLCEEYFSVE